MLNASLMSMQVEYLTDRNCVEAWIKRMPRPALPKEIGPFAGKRYLEFEAV